MFLKIHMPIRRASWRKACACQCSILTILDFAVYNEELEWDGTRGQRGRPEEPASAYSLRVKESSDRQPCLTPAVVIVMERTLNLESDTWNPSHPLSLTSLEN